MAGDRGRDRKVVDREARRLSMLVQIEAIGDVRFPDPGCGREICVVSADVKEPGQVMQIVETVWGVNAMGPNWIIVVDADADIDDWNDIWWRMYSRTEKIRFTRG